MLEIRPVTVVSSANLMMFGGVCCMNRLMARLKTIYRQGLSTNPSGTPVFEGKGGGCGFLRGMLMDLCLSKRDTVSFSILNLVIELGVQ